MAFDFPNNPSPGQTYTVAGIIYMWDGIAWSVATNPQMFMTARARNRIVNPNTWHSQENAGNTMTASGSYIADQWVMNFAGIVCAGSRTTLSILSPEGGLYALGFGATTAKASLAATDSLSMQQPIEGIEVVDFQWGTPAAKQAVLRFNVYAGVAGTYTIALRNAALDRSFIAAFNVPVASTWTTIVIVIPPCFDGVWVKSNALSIYLNITYAAGSNSYGVPGWQTGNSFSLPGITNGASVANAFMYVTDIGLYVDPDNTGRAPPFEVPMTGEELQRCQRYWEYMNFTDLFMMTRIDGGVQMGAVWWYLVNKRVPATVTFTNSGTGISAYMPMINGVEFLTSTMQNCAITSARANARM